MILLAYGTRPEYIKLKSLMYELDFNNIKYKTLFTGQHVNLLKDLKPDYQINIHEWKNGNRLDVIISSILDGISIDNIFNDITHVLVQGDTSSVLAVALSAFNHGIKVIHLEAGLRTYDNFNPYPEEINRRLVSQVADIHLCPTLDSMMNLENERIQGAKYIVGNTVLDNLLPYKKNCKYGTKILVTLHRRENHYWLDQWFIELEKLAEHYIGLEFILPLHPNPNVQKYKDLLKKYVHVIDPLPYNEMLELLSEVRMVITDSGGLQEESSFLNKKCLTCRKVTERPEAIGLSTFMVESPDKLFDVFREHIDNFEIDYDCPFGDGHAAEKIVKILSEL